MRTITLHLWFDKEAKEAADFYVSLLPDSRITNVVTLRDTPSGDCDVVSFQLAGSMKKFDLATLERAAAGP